MVSLRPRKGLVVDGVISSSSLLSKIFLYFHFNVYLNSLQNLCHSYDFAAL